MFAVSEGQRDIWHIETACHGESVVQIRKQEISGILNSGAASHDTEARVSLIMEIGT